VRDGDAWFEAHLEHPNGGKLYSDGRAAFRDVRFSGADFKVAFWSHPAVVARRVATEEARRRELAAAAAAFAPVTNRDTPP
jgi:hypothetical protein